MSTTLLGKDAEQKVADYLHARKHKILAMNWRTRWCEIDIISTKDKVVYFTEVKYRSAQHWGEGLDYITPQKLKQMHFAAELWLVENKWRGEALLQAAEVNSQAEINCILLEN